VSVFVKLSLTIKRDGHLLDESLTLTCPARKRLIDVVRPLLRRNLTPTSINRGDLVHVKLDNTGTPQVSWTSEADRFVVIFLLTSLLAYCGRVQAHKPSIKSIARVSLSEGPMLMVIGVDEVQADPIS